MKCPGPSGLGCYRPQWVELCPPNMSDSQPSGLANRELFGERKVGPKANDTSLYKEGKTDTEGGWWSGVEGFVHKPRTPSMAGSHQKAWKILPQTPRRNRPC